MSNIRPTIVDAPEVAVAEQAYALERRQGVRKRIAFDRLMGALESIAIERGLKVSNRKDFDTEDYEQLGQQPSEFVRQVSVILERLPFDIRPPRRLPPALATAISRARLDPRNDPLLAAAPVP
jgi:hypothetical protein